MTDNRKTELLPCPFCGGEAEMRTKKDICLDGLFYRYRCNDCHAGIAEWSACADGKEWSAAAKWNTRAELGSGTCEVECFDDGVDEGIDGEWFSYAPPTWYLSCGHTAQGTEKPNFCPVCGKAVKR